MSVCFGPLMAETELDVGYQPDIHEDILSRHTAAVIALLRTAHELGIPLDVAADDG